MNSDQIQIRVLSGLRWTVLARSSMQLITWFATLFVVRLLSPTDYGLVAMSTVVAFYLVMIGEMGLTAALVQRRDIDLGAERSIFGALLIAGGALFMLSAALAPLVARHFSEPRIVPMIILVSAQFLVLPFSVIPQARLSKELRFAALGIAGVASALAGATVTLLSAYLGYGAYALIFGNLASVLVRAASINFMSPFLHSPRLNPQSLKSVVGFSGFVLADRTLWYWYSQFDTLIVGSWLGAALLGSYSVAKQLAAMPLERFGEVMNTVALPAYAAVQHDMDRVRETYIKTIRLSAIVTIPAFWGFGLVASDLVEVVLGSRWHSAVPVLQWLCAMLPLRAIGSLASPAVTAIGRPGVSLKCMTVTAAIVVPALAMGARWQIVGVAAAWTLSYPLAYLANARLVGQCMKLPLGRVLAPLLKPIVCGLAMVGGVLALQSLIAAWRPVPVRLACQVVSGALVYFAALWILARADGLELLEFARRFFSRARPVGQGLG